LGFIYLALLVLIPYLTAKRAVIDAHACKSANNSAAFATLN